MYVFKEFNRTHGELVRTSVVLYLGTLFVLWPATSFFITNLATAVTITLLGLAVAHIVRIARLIDLQRLKLTAAQYVVAFGAALIITLLAIFAVSQTTANEPEYWWGTFKAVLLSLSLGTYISVHVDFAIVSLFRRSS